MKIKIDIKLNLYNKMLRIRKIEEAISKNYKDQEIRCPVHLSIGQEAIAVGICENLKTEDKIVTAHRSHAHFLAKGGSLNQMIAELYGKETGCAKGLGGSMHLVDMKAGVYAAVPIVGSTIPIGTGIAWANKLKKKKDIVVVFFGDGATEEGVFFESLDFASLHSLPILFVCENNSYSVYSHISKRQSKKRNLIKIARSLGIKSLQIDGNSIEKIFLQTKDIVKKIRKHSIPHFIELKTFRKLEHCGPNNDDHLNYRSKSYLKKWINKCPVVNYERLLENKKNLPSQKKINMEKKIKKEVDNAFIFAKKSKFPKKSILTKSIYEK